MKNKLQMLQVLIAEKTSHARLVLEEIINQEPDLHLVGVASNGDELLTQLKHKPADVVILDVSLPKNNRLFTVKRIFSESPTPIVLVVAQEQLTLQMLQEATELGVYAVIIKPKRFKYRELRAEVVEKVNAVREAAFRDAKDRLQLLRQEVVLTEAQRQRQHPPVTASTVIVMGASTGGTQAIEAIVKELSHDLKACILIAVHLPQRFTKSFAARLKELTKLNVLEGRNGLSLKPGKIIVAPGGKNMVVQPALDNTTGPRIGFSDQEVAHYDSPSVDLLMQSVAASAIQQVIGVILTGMGKDGTLGAGSIKARGGITIAQNEASCAIFGMAKSAIESGNISRVLPLSQIPHYLNAYAAQKEKVSETGSIT